LKETSPHDYHIVGLDYVITNTNKAILIEINSNPAINNFHNFEENIDLTNEAFEITTNVNITNFMKCVVGLAYEDCILIRSDL